MIYALRHLTTYSYEAPVSFASCALRLSPHAGADQQVYDCELIITPAPSRLRRHLGPFGETVTSAIVETPHTELTIEARSRVEVHRAAPQPPYAGLAWESVKNAAVADTALDVLSPANFLYPTRRTPIVERITDYGRRCFSPGRPIVQAAFELAGAIRGEFDYAPSSTDVGTPVTEAFDARHGVCQDFAHIMVCALRGLGLPAAYISGYLRTYPPPGKPRLEGADATHAWVSLWCGQADGWVGFDPTNALVVANEHIVLAQGRDYGDAAPIGGIILAPGDQTIEVEVDVKPLA